MRTLFASAFVALLAAALLASGCGGDDELTKAQFIQQADAICKQGNKRIDAVANETFQSGRPSAAELEQFSEETLIPDIQRQIDEVRALDEPSDDSDQVNAFLDSAQAEVDKGKKDPQYITSKQSFSETNKLGQAYGFKVCSED